VVLLGSCALVRQCGKRSLHGVWDWVEDLRISTVPSGVTGITTSRCVWRGLWCVRRVTTLPIVSIICLYAGRVKRTSRRSNVTRP
jgi:hypothetical protein